MTEDQEVSNLRKVISDFYNLEPFNTEIRKISPTPRREIDTTKVNTLEDVKLVLETLVQVLDMRVTSEYKDYDKIKHLLKE
jgi:hypothetical protein